MTNISNTPPRVVLSAPPEEPTEFSTMNSTPEKLTASPIIPCAVIRSLSAMAATIIVITGVIRLSTEASTAVVMVIASKNENCVRNSPSIDASAIFHRSLTSTLSLVRVTVEAMQKSSRAPAERSRNSDIGDTLPSLAMFLQKIILNPNIR